MQRSRLRPLAYGFNQGRLRAVRLNASVQMLGNECADRWRTSPRLAERFPIGRDALRAKTAFTAFIAADVVVKRAIGIAIQAGVERLLVKVAGSI